MQDDFTVHVFFTKEQIKIITTMIKVTFSHMIQFYIILIIVCEFSVSSHPRLCVIFFSYFLILLLSQRKFLILIFAYVLDQIPIFV